MNNKPTIQNYFRAFVRHFDQFLSRSHRIKVFSIEPDVIVRIQVDRLSHSVLLPGGIIPAGAKAIYLHLWNERLPAMPSEGADLTYARSFYHQMLTSLEALGRYIQEDESLQDVIIVGGVTSHVLLSGENKGGSLMLSRLGFTLFPSTHPLQKIGLFLDNFYTWVLMWTFNPVSLHSHKLLKLQRVEGWMGASKFLERYGSYDQTFKN
jgi:hypothetical protein